MDKPATGNAPGGKRKRSGLAQDELQAFSNMTEAVKYVAQAIWGNKPIDMHPNLYKAAMSIVDFSEEALGHLIDHKAQGTNFVGMEERHKTLWLRTYMSKHYYNM
jgi:hypothetical protein